MSEDNNKPNDDLSRDELNEELDKLKEDEADPETEHYRAPWITCYDSIEPLEDDENRNYDDDDLLPSPPPEIKLLD